MTLSLAQKSRRAELENVIERGLSTFVEVGNALLEIRDSKLYRETHPTFEAYCRHRWRISRSYAYRQIKAASVAGLLSPIGDIAITESQARALSSMGDDAERIAETWRDACADGNPTAEKIRAIIANKWHRGAFDGKHYWLTPHKLYRELQSEFQFDFDPCPYPKPPGFDGLSCEWGKSNYVNPPFGSIIHDGKKTGPTAWARKAIGEYRKGKRVVFVYPLDRWVLMMLTAGAQVRNLGDVHWLAIEDGSTGTGTGRHIAAFILEPLKAYAKRIPKGERCGLRTRIAATVGRKR
jgi:hypothetical protein